MERCKKRTAAKEDSLERTAAKEDTLERTAAKEDSLEGKYTNFLVSRGDLSVLIEPVPELYCLALDRWRKEWMEYGKTKWRQRLKCKTVKL